jgi:transcriptional regulator with XRE-family HTH domain
MKLNRGGVLVSLHIGSKIKALRNEKKLSQQDLCGDYINRVVLSRIENGKMLPSFSQLEYISNKLGVAISYFLSGMNYSERIKETDIIDDSYVANLFKLEHYFDVIKLNEHYPDKFNTIKGINKYYYLGMSYYNSDIFKEALKPLKKFINNYSKASKEIQQIYIIDFAIALNTLNKLMLRNKNYIKAEHYLLVARKYLAYFNEINSFINFIVHNNLAFIYAETNQYEKAISAAEHFLNSTGNILYMNIMPNLHKILNIAYYNVGNYELSIKHIKKAIQLYLYEENYISAAGCYVNFINSLRYFCKYEEAINLIEKCKNEFIQYEDIYLKFMLQEITLLFNIKEYKKVLELSEQLQVSKLKKISKCNLNFMIGHILYLEGHMKESYNRLITCEKVFKQQNFTHDLAVIYKDLFLITKNESYNTNQIYYAGLKGKRNII